MTWLRAHGAARCGLHFLDARVALTMRLLCKPVRSAPKANWPLPPCSGAACRTLMLWRPSLADTANGVSAPGGGSLAPCGILRSFEQLSTIHPPVNGVQIPYLVVGCGGHAPLAKMSETYRTPFVAAWQYGNWADDLCARIEPHLRREITIRWHHGAVVRGLPRPPRLRLQPGQLAAVRFCCK